MYMALIKVDRKALLCTSLDLNSVFMLKNKIEKVMTVGLSGHIYMRCLES